MRLVETRTVEIGTKLAKAIYNENGKILVNKGVTLQGHTLLRLIQLGITYIYIEDKQTEDIVYHDAISEPMKREAMSTIVTTFKQLQSEPFSAKSFVLEKSVKEYKQVIRHLVDELRKNPDLMSILSDVCVHDSYIFTHSMNVTLYALAVGIELKLNPKQLEMVGLGALMHDIGKVIVPTDILLKPGKLTEEEFMIIQMHPEEGFELLRKTPAVPLLVAHCAFQHHERLDGKGYPRGIKGSEIHNYAKIITVADVFDAVTSNRIYRAAMLPHEGLELLYSGVEKQFDTNIVRAFHKAVAIYPVGITVELNDGRRGVVVKQNVLSDRPTVRILEEQGHPVIPYEISLMEKLSVVITGCDTTFKRV